MVQPDWTSVEVELGCVPKVQAAPPVMAPTDLRGVPLPAGWATLRQIYLTPGNTEYLPGLPDSVERLTVEKNRLVELPSFPNSLQFIHLDHNELTSLPSIPQFCRILSVKHNRLERIPSPLPPFLELCYVTHNHLTELPAMEHTRLVSIGAGFNQLTSLPTFPDTLRMLGCPQNQITVLSNLPDRLEVLNCAFNPLKVLQIDNLRRLTTIVANHCGLTRIPILPLHESVNDDNDYDDDDNNDDNNENENEYRNLEMGPRVILHGNPFEPAFQRLYDQYEGNRNYGWLRRHVLKEHRRILAQQKATLGAMIQTFKAKPQGSESQERVFASHGPGNLIAQFITGKPGTLEAQRLALVENQERVGAVPPGTAEKMREQLVEIAVDPSSRLQERAKLYIREANIAAAEAAAEELVAEKNDGKKQNGGRNHRTPRNRKGTRQTRKH